MMRWVLGLVFACSAGPGSAAQTLPVVRIETTHGTILAQVDTIRAPRTAGNFLRYVDAGLYDGGGFYRVVTADNQPDDDVRIEVIQGGIDPAKRVRRWAPIALEPTSVTGLRHLDGVLSMARAGPHTASSEFFICIGDQPSLNHGGARNPDGLGFAAFGRVIEGMDVVRAIQRLPAQGQRVLERVRMIQVRTLPS